MARHPTLSPLKPLIALLTLALLSACAQPASKLPTPEQAYSTRPAYNYPIEDPYAATVITLPPDMKVDYSSVPEPSEENITLFEDRKIPDGFWYQRGLHYSQLLQKKPAPLVYIIPGTGANNKASIMITVADILYHAGFSVVLLPSPSNPNFIINASQNFLPGSPMQDAHDLYRLMLAIDARVAKETTITSHMLLGYSLGAWQSAFTAEYDDQQKQLNFQKVLLINPPLNLYSSMKILDDDLMRDLPHGMNDADTFLKSVITRFSKLSPNSEAFNFENSQLLLDYYKKYHPSDDRLASMIGLSFRLTAADMVFTSDVMRHGNYIFPKNAEFTTSTSLNYYMAIAIRTSFTDYLNDVFYEEQHTLHPEITKQALAHESDLESLSPFIQGNPKFRLITNRDDVILAPGEINTLESLFAGHEVIFPTGGHLGNIAHPAVAYQIVTFMKQQ